MEVQDVSGRTVEPGHDPLSELLDLPFNLINLRSDDGGSFLRHLKLDWIRVVRLVYV